MPHTLPSLRDVVADIPFAGPFLDDLHTMQSPDRPAFDGWFAAAIPIAPSLANAMVY